MAFGLHAVTNTTTPGFNPQEKSEGKQVKLTQKILPNLYLLSFFKAHTKAHSIIICLDV